MADHGTPYFDESGALVIPFAAEPRYHYWNGGQPLAETLKELGAPEGVWKNHTTRAYPGQGG
jgi:hypothetical protein